MFDLDQIESASPYTRSAPDDVCFGSKADIGPHQLNVRFTPESGHSCALQRCPLCATSRLMQCSKERRYSIISSAAVNNLSGIVSPSALAVLRLMISSNFVGAFAPDHRLRDVDAAIEICGSYMRELSDNPILRAFRHVALSVRFRFLAILPAGVFFRASDFKVRTSAVVQARLLNPFFTI